ncbi:IPT/TIG domain-containing protein [Winogradskyella sp. R77965]|uniref:IPT/TIG domain-containing protein n=1 Tax=Winogradskyella sp. R77965 TaxID=3093872 RepID=UPI0037DD2BE2
MLKKTLIFLLIFSVVSCNHDDNSEPSNANVAVETLQAEMIPEGGVKLKGNINGVELDLNYGFIISQFEGETTMSSYNIQKNLSGTYNGDFEISFRNDLNEDQTYYYRAFAYSSNAYTFGEEKSFISNGSSPSQIESVEPNIAHVSDTITIRGKYFSSNPSIFFDEINSETIIKNDSLIKCIVPYSFNLQNPYSTIKVKKSTQEETIFDDFSLYAPEVYAISPSVAYETDTLTISGNHFHKQYLRNRLEVEINGNFSSLQILESTRTEIVFVNAGAYYNLQPRLRLKSQFQSIEFDDKLTALMPSITGVPECITFDENFTIYGENFPRYNFTLRVGENSFTPQSLTRDSIVLDSQTGGVYQDFNLENVTINYLGEEIIYESNICVDEPWIQVSSANSLSTHSYIGETYALYYIPYNFFTVAKFNDETYEFESINNTELPNEIVAGSTNTFYDTKLYSYEISPFVGNDQEINFRSYDFFTNEISELASFPGGDRSNALIETVGDYIYFGLGSNSSIGGDAFADIWRYSIINDSWEFVLNFPGIDSSSNAKRNPLTFIIDDSIYIGAGQNGYHTDFWELNTITNTVISRSDLPIAISDFPGGHVGTSINGKGYFDNFYLHEYDPITDTWYTYNDIPSFVATGISSQSIFNHNGILYRSFRDSYINNTRMLKLNASYLN